MMRCSLEKARAELAQVQGALDAAAHERDTLAADMTRLEAQLAEASVCARGTVKCEVVHISWQGMNLGMLGHRCGAGKLCGYVVVISTQLSAVRPGH
jgi:hypothetical protein